MARSFEDKIAERERVPLLVGLVGPSGSGKTYSALRLATGIQRQDGGDIFFVDTEARRALHYADRFRFRHIAFGAPFGSLDYLAAIEHCVKQGGRTIIVDSMSHEHEGPGGMLEQHAAETKRLAALWKVKESVAQMSAWGPPKAERRRMINSILQFPVNFIFCFRAKNKLKIKKGEDPKAMGYMPIAGEEFVFEMTVNCLLLPGARGVPTWRPEEPGEKEMIKLPEQFRELFSKDVALSEDTGQALAKWAAGSVAEGGLYAELKGAIAMADDAKILQLAWPRLDEVKAKKSLPPGQYNALVAAFVARKKELEDGAQARAEALARGESLEDPPMPTADTDEDDVATGTDG